MRGESSVRHAAPVDPITVRAAASRLRLRFSYYGSTLPQFF